jgi:cell wall-associated NlpC family hydrolase
MRTTALTDDGWAILALPLDGGRDLACEETWQRSLKRSQLRRSRAETARRNLPASRKVGVAIAASAILAPLAQQTASAQETASTTASTTTTTATTATSGGLLRQGSSGPEVSRIQSQLGISADGVFGPATKAAVIAYQQKMGLLVDGIVGPQTRGALGGNTSSGTSSTGTSNDGPKPSQSVTVAVQQKLGLSADGAYGPQTRSAVKAFQARNGLEADGIVGPATMAKLGISGSTEQAPSSSGGGGSAVSAAQSVIGTPYAYGGSTTAGFDCSGLVVYAFKQAGVSLPRTSFAQFGAGSAVDRSSIQAGDLVFFNANGPGASHVGIATSNSTVISATTRGVREHAISDSYWGSHYVGARRV